MIIGTRSSTEGVFLLQRSADIYTTFLKWNEGDGTDEDFYFHRGGVPGPLDEIEKAIMTRLGLSEPSTGYDLALIEDELRRRHAGPNRSTSQ